MISPREDGEQSGRAECCKGAAQHAPREPGSIWRRWRVAFNRASPFVNSFLSLAILAATVTYTGYAGQQWHTMQRQLGGMCAQLDVMEESNRINNLALTATQRPVVTIKPPRIREIPDPHNLGSSLYAFEMQWNNSGNTPTTNLVLKWRYYPRESNSATPWEFRDDKDTIVNQVIPAKDTIGIGTYFMSHEEASQCARGQKQCFFIAEATYGDLFGSPIPYVVRSCMKFTGFSGPKEPEKYIPDFDPCQTHNCSDQQCDEKKLVAVPRPVLRCPR